MTTMNQLFGKLRTSGGCIVPSGDCSTLEIADAQARGDFTADAALSGLTTNEGA